MAQVKNENTKESLKGKEGMLEEILETELPPVGRLRLMSNGMEPYYAVQTETDIAGDKSCLACGNCVDSCAVLRREPERLEETSQRTSYALESVVAEDCEQCYSCALACPMINKEYKEYIADNKIQELVPDVKPLRWFDNYYALFVAIVFGILFGIFIVI